MRVYLCITYAICMLALSMPGYAAPIAEQEAAIAAAMHQLWDKPDQHLDIPLIVIDGEFAIADWTQGQKGGRALLKYQTAHADWQTLICGGAALTDPKRLQQAGVSLATAENMTQALRLREHGLSPGQKSLVNSFPGVMLFTHHQAARQRHEEVHGH